MTRANLKCTGGFLAFKEMMIEKLSWMPFNVKKFDKFGASVLKDQRQIIDELAILSIISNGILTRVAAKYMSQILKDHHKTTSVKKSSTN